MMWNGYAFGLWHGLFWLVGLVLILVPSAKILTKAGFSAWWSLLLLLPLVNLIALWVFAFADWPRGRDRV